MSKKKLETFIKSREINRLPAMREVLSKRVTTDEERKNYSVRAKQIWRRPGYRDKMVKMHQLSGNNWHKFTNERGEKYQSKQEIVVADYLYSKKITYKLHTRLKISDKWVCSDFYLPKFNLYVEYFGSFHWDDINIDRNGKERNAEKINLYKSNNVPFIGIYPPDLDDLDSVFLELRKIIKLSEPPFYTICGEGTEIGLLATFIRGYGCNRRCTYCDTKYSYEGEHIELSVRNILDIIYGSICQRRCKRIFLTGGEMTIQENLKYLVNALVRNKFEVILQTNGTKFIPEIFDKVKLLSVDVKGPSSGKLADLSIIDKIYRKYPLKSQFKFVVSNREDYNYAKSVVPKLAISEVILQPEWNSGNVKMISKWLLNDKEMNFYEVRVLPQFHKMLGIK